MVAAGLSSSGGGETERETGLLQGGVSGGGGPTPTDLTVNEGLLETGVLG